MLRRLLAFALSLSIWVPSATNSVAHPIDEKDVVLSQRVYALVYPDILRAMCSKQPQEVKDRAERALASSGFLKMSLKEVCANEACVKAAGGDGYSKDALREMISNFRDEQVASWKARSAKDMEKTCTVVIEGMERASEKRGLKPEQAVKEIADYIAERL